MQFRPCIDIHNGKVKQIVGGSLRDENDSARENFVADKDAGYYAGLYREKGLEGGHVILLNPSDSPYYEADLRQAFAAFKAFPGGLQAGGGIKTSNAGSFLDAGASHVIVTSYVFREGRIDYDRLRELKDEVGREHLVLDLSARKRDGAFYVVTDRWQRYTDEEVTAELLGRLSDFCDEFLVHAVDVEGRGQGIEPELLSILARNSGNSITYAGGVSDMDSLLLVKRWGGGRINVTVGSALDIFGGHLALDDVIRACSDQEGLCIQ